MVVFINNPKVYTTSDIKICITIGTSFLGKILPSNTVAQKKIENNKLHLRLLRQPIETIHDF